jgi:hypothetical protein
MAVFMEALKATLRVGIASAGVATCIVMLIAAGTVLAAGHYVAGLIFAVGSLWLFRYSAARMWSLVTEQAAEG